MSSCHTTMTWHKTAVYPLLTHWKHCSFVNLQPHKTSSWELINTLRPRQNGRHFPDDIFKCIFLNENIQILIEISLKFVPKGPINNIPALVQIMAWRRPGDKPLSEPVMVELQMHKCVTRPQWVKCSEIPPWSNKTTMRQWLRIKTGRFVIHCHICEHDQS